MYSMKNNLEYVIREANIEDAEKLVDYVNQVAGESDNLTFGSGEFGMTVEKEVSFVKASKESDNALMLVADLNGEIISSLSYTGGRRKRIRHCGEFGISVKEKYWSQGVGETMINQLIQWCEKSKYCEKLNLRVREDNIKSINLYEKLGFKKEGLLLKDMKINGEFVNCIVMGRDIIK